MSFAVLLTLCSCDNTSDAYYYRVVEPKISFFSRPCDAISVFNIELSRQPYSPDVPDGKGFQAMSVYGIRIDVNDEKRDHIPYISNASNWKQIERDADMEDEIIESLRRVESVPYVQNSSYVSEVRHFIDYRQEKLTGLKVFCSEMIFGEDPGTDISDHFMICFSSDAFEHPLFSADRHLVKDSWPGWTVDTMLSKGVLAMDSIFLGFSDFPEEVPQGDLYFEIELSVEGKDPFKAAAPPVNFNQ